MYKKLLSKIDIKIIKYLIVGVLSTLIDIGVLYFCHDILKISLYISILLAFILSVINGFILNKIFTFEDKSKKHKTQFVKFLIVAIGGLALTYFFMYIFTDLLGIWYIFSKILTSFIVVIYNFTLNKKWTFKKEQIKQDDENINYDCKYSIVIPAYNEQNRIIDTLNKIDDYLKSKEYSYEIIVVDDGSVDNTVKIVDDLKKEIKILKNIKNRGKGYSIKSGVLSAKGEYILFTDADNSTPIEEMEKLAKYIEEYDIVIGSRYLSESNIVIEQGKLRKLISRGGHFLISHLLLSGFQDTQCGFKMFKNRVAKKIFKMQKISGWGFDMEVLLAGKTLGYKIKEVAINWFDSAKESKVSPIKDSIKILGELIIIKINHLFDGYK